MTNTSASTPTTPRMTTTTRSSASLISPRLQQQQQQQQQESGSSVPGTPTHSPRPVMRRRIRRKASSTLDDPAEQLTEMSVRGLNLFRYAIISEGVYQCTECAKEDIQKTFKNKYSFQRHAFLYHEGAQRKVFPCPVCGKEFSRPDKMKNHLKTTHDCNKAALDIQYNPLSFLIGSAGSEMINNNNNNNTNSVLDEDAGNNQDVMTALGLSFNANNRRKADGNDVVPNAEVMAALGLSYSAHTTTTTAAAQDSIMSSSIKNEMVVDGAD